MIYFLISKKEGGRLRVFPLSGQQFGNASGESVNPTLHVQCSMDVRNAYPEGTVGYVDIQADADQQFITFVISDSGIPFDPTQKEEVDTTLSVEEREVGGLGIHLVRTIMDSVSYEYIDHKNILTLRKEFNKQ